MSPPPAAALVLLGIWVLTIFFVTNETGYAQLLSDGDDAVTVPEPKSATDEPDVNARAGFDDRGSSATRTLDSVSDADSDQESESTPGIRSPADD